MSYNLWNTVIYPINFTTIFWSSKCILFSSNIFWCDRREKWSHANALLTLSKQLNTQNYNNSHFVTNKPSTSSTQCTQPTWMHHTLFDFNIKLPDRAQKPKLTVTSPRHTKVFRVGLGSFSGCSTCKPTNWEGGGGREVIQVSSCISPQQQFNCCLQSRSSVRVDESYKFGSAAF